jgi:hypothetical protein
LLLAELPPFDRQPHIGPRDVNSGRLPVRHDHARRHPSAQDAARAHAAAQLDHAPVMLNVKRGDAPSDRGIVPKATRRRIYNKKTTRKTWHDAPALEEPGITIQELYHYICA